MPMTLKQAIEAVREELVAEEKACEPSSFAKHKTVYETAEFDELVTTTGDQEFREAVSLLIWEIPDFAQTDSYRGIVCPAELRGKKIALYYYSGEDSEPFHMHSEEKNKYQLAVMGLRPKSLTKSAVLAFNEVEWPAMQNGELYNAEKHDKAKENAKYANILAEYIQTNPQDLQVSEEDTNMVSYAQKNKVKRQKTTLARFVAKNIPGFGECPDKIKELLQTRTCKYTFDVSQAFSILTGDDIVEAYRNAVGGHSCMAGKSHNQMLDMYRQCPDDIGLAVFRTPDKTGRAIVWKNAKKKNGTTVVAVDRVYPAGDAQIYEFFDAWAKQNGYLIRPLKSNDFSEPLCVELEASKVVAFPYLDTFQRATSTETPEGGLKIRLFSSSWKEQHNVTLTHQHGGGPQTAACPKCDQHSRVFFSHRSYGSICPNCAQGIKGRSSEAGFINPLLAK